MWVEDDVEPVYYLEETLSEVICTKECIINAFGFVLYYVGDNFINSVRVYVSRDVSLWCSFVLEMTPSTDEHCEVEVIFVY